MPTVISKTGVLSKWLRYQGITRRAQASVRFVQAGRILYPPPRQCQDG